MERLAGFRRTFPRAALGADLIVGFPGENESHFETTCRNIEKIGLSYAHIFRYSPRPGTAAFGCGGQVSETEKKLRSIRIREIVKGGRGSFMKSVLQSRQRIIVESCTPVRGVTSNYIRVEIPDCAGAHNSWMDILVTGPASGKFWKAQPLYSKVA